MCITAIWCNGQSCIRLVQELCQCMHKYKFDIILHCKPQARLDKLECKGEPPAQLSDFNACKRMGESGHRMKQDEEIMGTEPKEFLLDQLKLVE